MSDSRQLSLFGIMPRPQPREEDVSAGELLDSSPASTDAAIQQIDLFADRACLARDLDSALRVGDFRESCRLRRLFEQTYGVSPETRALSFLEGLADPLAAAPPQQALSIWRGLDSRLENHPRLRRLFRQGVFRWLLGSHSAEELAAASPASLPALALSLASGLAMPPEDGKRQGRRLIRDALLAGLRLDPIDFRWDEPVADLLGEDDEPAWLACLGAIRRLWPVVRLMAHEIDELSGRFVEPASGEQAAQAFWRCLSAAEDRDCPEDARHEVRRRLKTLRPEFHALYMRRVRA